MANLEIKYVSPEKLGYYDSKAKARMEAADEAIRAALQANIDKANQAIAAEETRAKAAEATNALAAENAQKAADAAQTDVNTLAGKVGTVPENQTVMGIITGIQESAYDDTELRGLVTDNTEAIEALTTTHANDKTSLEQADSALAARIKTVEDDYLKAADKTELTNAINAEKERAEGIEGGLNTRLQAVELDYLKSADKTELQGKIDTVDGLVDTLVGEDTGKSARTIANEELAKQLVAEGAKESLDTLAEIAAWIQSHPDDAAAMNKAIEDLEALVGTLPEGVTATTIVGYIQEVVAAEKSRAEEVESGLDTRLKAVEDKFKDGEGSVSDQISDAKTEVLNQAAQDATTKANTAESNAKSHADGLNTAMNARVEALEAIDHDHANKAELDKIADGDVAKWNAAEANAKAHADSLNTAMDGRMDTIETSLAEGGATANAIADAKKAGTDAQAEVDALELVVGTPDEGKTVVGMIDALEAGQVTTNATNITALQEDVAELQAVTHTEITNAEIDAMFETV